MPELSDILTHAYEAALGAHPSFDVMLQRGVTNCRLPCERSATTKKKPDRERSGLKLSGA